MAAEMHNLIAATKAYRKLETRYLEARATVHEAVIAALRAGESPSDVAANSPYSAAHVRNLAREHGIEPARPGPKTRTKH